MPHRLLNMGSLLHYSISHFKMAGSSGGSVKFSHKKKKKNQKSIPLVLGFFLISPSPKSPTPLSLSQFLPLHNQLPPPSTIDDPIIHCLRSAADHQGLRLGFTLPFIFIFPPYFYFPPTTIGDVHPHKIARNPENHAH
jgi:hypothetical protein